MSTDNGHSCDDALNCRVCLRAQLTTQSASLTQALERAERAERENAVLRAQLHEATRCRHRVVAGGQCMDCGAEV